MHEATLTIPVKPPFRLDLTVWVLRRLAKNSIDNWDEGRYQRALVLEDKPVLVTAHQEANALSARLKSSQPLHESVQDKLKSALRKLLGLDVDLESFYRLAANNPTLDTLTKPFVGVRPPRFPSLFETLVNAIACQQVSLDVGILLLNRLAQQFGKSLTDGNLTLHAFPEPQDLVAVPESELKKLGFSYQKARAIQSVAYAVANGDIKLEQLEASTNEEALSKLQLLHGIGRWSAEYVLLRGLGRLDVFPGDDIGGQNNLQRLLGLETRPNYEELSKLTAIWHPYAGLIYFHLLLNKLHEKGLA